MERGLKALRLISDITESSGYFSALSKKIMTIQTDFSISNGISLLDVKSHLFFSYLTDLTYLMSLKSSGRSIDGDSAIL